MKPRIDKWATLYMKKRDRTWDRDKLFGLEIQEASLGKTVARWFFFISLLFSDTKKDFCLLLRDCAEPCDERNRIQRRCTIESGRCPELKCRKCRNTGTDQKCILEGRYKDVIMRPIKENKSNRFVVIGYHDWWVVLGSSN